MALRAATIRLFIRLLIRRLITAAMIPVTGFYSGNLYDGTRPQYKCMQRCNFLRLMLRSTACLVLVLGLAAGLGKPAEAQPRQALLPEQSTAKARALLQQVIAALGGRAFLDVRDSDCSGRVAQFGHNDELLGFTPFRDMWLLPDKNRTEYISKGQNTLFAALLGVDDLSITHGGTLITVFNGKQGWMLDKAGLSDQPEDSVKNFVEQVKSGMNNMLRSRMNEDGVEFHYAGSDLLDLKEAEWIEFSDRDRRTLRLAVDKFTHLPLRWAVVKRDPETRERSETVTSYTQYVLSDGIQTPLSISRTQNGRHVSQVFLTSCKYNTNFSPELFTRVSLEQRQSEITKKGYKVSKDNK